MEKKMPFVIIGAVTSLLLISLLAVMVTPVYSGTPTQPHPADAMWVEPSSTTFTPENATVGQKFNVTVWLNITSWDVFSYQIALHYNRTQLKATRAGFTKPPTSDFMQGHTTTPTGPVIDTSFLGNGSVLAYETCLGDDFIPAPHVGSLIWIEFQILTTPPEGQTYTSKFDITKETPANNWVCDKDINYHDPTTYDGNYTVIPEFSSLIILLVFFALTIFASAFQKKLIRKLKFM